MLQQTIDQQRQYQNVTEQNQTLRWQLRNSEEKIEMKDSAYRVKVDEYK